MQRGRWIDKIHPGVRQELMLDDEPALQLLHFLASAPAFIAVVRQLTGCDTIAAFRGRIYRMLPGPTHQDIWHDDLYDEEDRLVGMSINVSPRVYSGGVFQMRRAESEDFLAELPNPIAGDAIVFRVSPELEHRVTSVDGTEPRTAFAGWFMSTGRDFLAKIKNRACCDQ